MAATKIMVVVDPLTNYVRVRSNDGTVMVDVNMVDDEEDGRQLEEKYQAEYPYLVYGTDDEEEDSE